MKNALLTLLCITTLFACNSEKSNSNSDANAETIIYYNGEIVTMEGKQGSTVESVVTKNNKVVFTGSQKEARSNYPNSNQFDLKGNTMFPGFIEQHMHPFLGALTLVMNVIAPESWELPSKTWKGVDNEKDYFATLTDVENSMENPDEILLSWGYHHNFHGDLNREKLDKISATRPILIWHRSVHEFFLNSVLMEQLGMTDAWAKTFSEEIQGQINIEKGHFFEAGAMIALLPKIFEIIGPEENIREGLYQMVEMLHNNGITAYNEPGAFIMPTHVKIYKEILGDVKTPMYSFFTPETKTPFYQNKEKGDEAVVKAVEDITTMFPETGKIRFFKKTVKLLIDGAIISQLMMMKGGYTDGHHGEWIQPPQEISDVFDIFWERDYQILVHVNGDKGLEELLKVIERKMKESPREDHRTTIIHFANSTEAQVKKISELGCIVSANPYYVTAFSDKYAEVGLGPERANAMVRSASVEKLGIPYSLHSDLPMAPANPLYLAWCAITRETLNGNHPRPDLRLSLHQALRGITIDAAQSWRMENELGSIKNGKIANFTILKNNPYKVEAEKLKDIEVLGTVFEGNHFPIIK
ncbi:amidohydrolase [Urechidicola vernalis]|uniref:Amidohydrolase n=1 Tax=Urechidicola vernalis TaxID=3075600 RepID=A0ABU2Y739_9FLAO|nr:amidohydrolase [Urechidicola sp. P050]MDT0553857.1 amidohydrolase [Urechidicola sp. P050]